ncbi:M56 family metallopeptidase [Flavobacterium defluvii]|uniref:Signal transducer regulating beta-lactamase production, contains metallopeptidase domain n=1 Tax=Flavobacterium defluvii TaxID=370979 RepID=A0A1M5U0B2_9FLAO|nr:M56 family metallopeptidase [Flavobacterium defluvii]SHH56439.1 Signal transducer regulating beta-lactamase production, contains metallopeptidase domain [Flavobacterium defluvii]
MEAILVYIAKSAGLIALFYCAYYFLLRKETFFNSNRWFLLTGLITSVLLPFIVYTKVIWVNPAPISNFNLANVNFIQKTESKTFEINWFYLLLAVYCIGFLILLIKFAIDYYSLNSVLKGKKVHQQADFKFIDTEEKIAPFSYFEYIVYNSSMYTPSELENIIEHEKVHSDQNHTIDVLISRAFCMIFWFNPVIWFYKKAIVQNLEFIADKEAAKKLSDKKAYQYTLLKITTHESCVAITNHFYQSLIKKRIVMLNKNQSKRRNSWKYYVVIPALAAFVLLFQIKVVAKEKQQTLKEIPEKIKSVDVYKVKKSSTDAELEKIKENLKKYHNVDFEVSDVKRNSDNNLTSIKVNIKNGKQQTQSIQVGGDKAIKDFGVVVITDEKGNKKIGIQTDDQNDAKIAVSKKITSVNTNQADNSEKASDSKTIITKKLTTKTDINVNTDSDTSTKNNSNTDTNISTVVTINKDNNTNTKTITTTKGSTIAISNSTKANVQQGHQLIIIDGQEMPDNFDYNNIDAKHIKSVNIYKGTNAVAKYGDKGADGVIEIETKH